MQPASVNSLPCVYRQILILPIQQTPTKKTHILAYIYTFFLPMDIAKYNISVWNIFWPNHSIFEKQRNWCVLVHSGFGRLTLHSRCYILSFVFPRNWTHDLGFASAMLYCLSCTTYLLRWSQAFNRDQFWYKNWTCLALGKHQVRLCYDFADI